jgi:hypothetical protein
MSDRKPQARSLDTRRRLREATLDTIVEVGLPRASTPKINERAGVSSGAQRTRRTPRRRRNQAWGMGQEPSRRLSEGQTLERTNRGPGSGTGLGVVTARGR